MKNLKWIWRIIGLITLVTITACNNDDDNQQTSDITFLFSHNWDGINVSNTDFNALKFTTEAGDLVSIERLRYVISDVEFIRNGTTVELDVYNLVDVTTNENLTFKLDDNVPQGSYTIRFTFGLDNEDNSENYLDLNSANFNVPDMLGGGYHYMQFDGKFINNINEEQGFNYHAIRAVDISSGSQVFPQDTFFTVTLDNIELTNTNTIEVKMNIAEWFKNPHTWQLNELNSVLMPNAMAQILMFDNGQSVFELGDIDN